eukprot:2437662-Prymnesium_polylepis.1
MSSDSCLLCPPGTTTSLPGSTNASDCIELPPGPPAPPPSPALPPSAPPPTQYVSSESQLTAALGDQSLGRVVLARGHYQLQAELVIDRSVALEAETPGMVVLDARGASRILSISSGVVALVGLNLTGG